MPPHLCRCLLLDPRAYNKDLSDLAGRRGERRRVVAESRLEGVLERKSLAGWRSAPALNPKMSRGLGVLLVSWKLGGNTRTHKDFRVVWATEA
jgi:hypothetical protein